MQIAILTVSSLVLVTSAATCVVMLKVRKDVLGFKADVDAEVAEVKTKSNAALRKVQGALRALEF